MDYQDDCLSIGLKEVLGEDVVDVNKRSHIYKSFSESDAAAMYGRGMTVTRILDDLDVDRSDIENRIKRRHFDLVIYGSIYRYFDFIELVFSSYPKNRIFLVDGEDNNVLQESAIRLGAVYFKRELVSAAPGVYPIHFAIPGCKINFDHVKRRDIAICDPRDRSSYIYRNEKEYYDGYGEARLAVTTRKAGWDCMRHYEILANGCLPLFLGINECPDQTLTSFDKKTCGSILRDYYGRLLPAEIYEKYSEAMKAHTLRNHTTAALAKYVLDVYKTLNP
jgi:hypothetical protein